MLKDRGDFLSREETSELLPIAEYPVLEPLFSARLYQHDLKSTTCEQQVAIFILAFGTKCFKLVLSHRQCLNSDILRTFVSHCHDVVPTTQSLRPSIIREHVSSLQRLRRRSLALHVVILVTSLEQIPPKRQSGYKSLLKL
jgi:hypothetical protein